MKITFLQSEVRGEEGSLLRRGKKKKKAEVRGREEGWDGVTPGENRLADHEEDYQR